MITTRISILACLASVLTASFMSAEPVSSQGAPGVAPVKPEKGNRINVSFLLLHEKYEGMDIYLAGADEKNPSEPIGPIHVHGTDFSGAVHVPKGSYKIVHSPDSPIKKARKPLCTINLEGIKQNRVLILLEPHKKTFRPHLVNPVDKKFAVNSTYFFNTTDLPIATDMGGVKTVVPAHGNVISSAPPRAGLPYYEVNFFYPEADGTPRKFECTRWPFRLRGRYYSFFFINPVTKGVSYRTVEEIVSFEPKDPE